MERELKDFIDDWEIDIRKKSAKHKSGLCVEYDSTNEDGSLRLAYSGMSTFLRNMYEESPDAEVIKGKYDGLTAEFVEIYKTKMLFSANPMEMAKPQREI